MKDIELKFKDTIEVADFVAQACIQSEAPIQNAFFLGLTLAYRHPEYSRPFVNTLDKTAKDFGQNMEDALVEIIETFPHEKFL